MLGGWGNTRSVIREGKSGPEKTAVDSGVMQRFIVTKAASNLKVLREDGTTVLEYASASIPVVEVWLMTGWGASAEWSQWSDAGACTQSHSLHQRGVA